MVVGAFSSRVEKVHKPWAMGHGDFPLIPGDQVITFCGDGSRVGEIERFESHDKYTQGSCVVDCVPVAFVRDLKTGEVKEAMPHLLKLAPDYDPPSPDFDADDLVGVINYLRLRHQPILDAGWVPASWPYRPIKSSYDDPDSAWGAVISYRKWDDDVAPEDRYKPPYPDFETRWAIYVFKSKRGQGHLTEYVKRSETFKFITLDDCNVAGFYEKLGRDCLVIPVTP